MLEVNNQTETSSHDKGLSLLDRIQPFLLIGSIALGLIIAYLFPSANRALSTVVTVGVFLVIYFIMLGVDLHGVMKAFTRWKPTVLAISINFIITPLFAWFLGYLFLRNDPNIWVGLILYLVTPCIGWYLVFTELARGDVELGVSLLFWNVLLQIVLMPVYMWLLAGTIVDIKVSDILCSVLAFLIFPLSLARATRYVLGRLKVSFESIKQQVRLPYLKTATLMVVIMAMFASQGNVLFANPVIVLKMILPGLVFFSTIFVLALFAGHLFKLRYSEVALLAFTTTARNSEASLAVAVTAFTSPYVALTVVIGPSLELPVLILLLRLLLWLREKQWFKI
ncbi:MAG: arsenic resistance protein [Candidatus Saccharicenans sp.]|uniref:arsenic resistance protein n=1 Tax=Candidatus Saccharicenans sp. TaxID=2819258 RepID=UPI00404987B9